MADDDLRRVHLQEQSSHQITQLCNRQTQLKGGQVVNVECNSRSAPQFIKLPNPGVQAEQAALYEAGKKDAEAYYAHSIQEE